jgi:shikimate kinase
MRTIVLMGFMGTGKSEVGRRLARRRGCAFVDTDRLIEQRAGKSIPAIFAEDGEPRFRSLEAEVVAEVAARPGGVLAVGGGAVLDAENARRLHETGVMVHLTARPETILERIGDVAERPLLAGCNPRAVIDRLFAERRPAYEALADVAVDTSDRSVDEVADEVERLVAGLAPGERWT